jgi:hypothetical protein
MGEMLDGRTVKHTPFINDLEKGVNRNADVVSVVLELISTGVHLWEKFRKGA